MSYRCSPAGIRSYRSVRQLPDEPVRPNGRHPTASIGELGSASQSADTSAAKTCAATGESRCCARATTGKAAEVATTKVAATGETTSTTMRTCPRWLSKTNESCAYQTKQFNLFHTGKFVAESLRVHCACVGSCDAT